MYQEKVVTLFFNQRGENYKKPPHIGQSFQKATTIRILFKKPPLYG
jgi:hypothetical protein